jgi:hypothetical protein
VTGPSDVGKSEDGGGGRPQQKELGSTSATVSTGNTLKFERVGSEKQRITTELKPDVTTPATDVSTSKRQTVTVQLQQPPSPVNIPPFYFPHGKPFPSKDADIIVQRIKAAFSALPDGRATRAQMADVAVVSDAV